MTKWLFVKRHFLKFQINSNLILSIFFCPFQWRPNSEIHTTESPSQWKAEAKNKISDMYCSNHNLNVNKTSIYHGIQRHFRRKWCGNLDPKIQSMFAPAHFHQETKRVCQCKWQESSISPLPQSASQRPESTNFHSQLRAEHTLQSPAHKPRRKILSGCQLCPESPSIFTLQQRN